MNGGEVVQVLQAAHAVGVEVRLDGMDLMLEASAPPPPALLDLLVHHKVDIVAMLRRDALTTKIARSRPPSLGEIAERSTAIQQGGQNDRNAVDRRALNEVGYLSLQASSDAHRIEIETALSELPAPCDHRGQRLLDATQTFLRSNWFLEAMGCGWMLEGLFGVDAYSPLEQYEQWGLVVGLAWAPQRDDTIEGIDDESAAICFRGGAWLEEKKRVERRFSPAVDTVLWWKCSMLVSDVE